MCNGNVETIDLQGLLKVEYSIGNIWSTICLERGGMSGKLNFNFYMLKMEYYYGLHSVIIWLGMELDVRVSYKNWNIVMGNIWSIPGIGWDVGKNLRKNGK